MYNKVLNHGKQKAIEALCYEAGYRADVSIEDGNDVIQGMEGRTFEELRADGFEVIYDADALAILDDAELMPNDELDFSECSDAMECVRMEARASVSDAFNCGFEEALQEIQDRIDSLIEYLVSYQDGAIDLCHIHFSHYQVELLRGMEPNMVIDVQPHYALEGYETPDTIYFVVTDSYCDCVVWASVKRHEMNSDV